MRSKMRWEQLVPSDLIQFVPPNLPSIAQVDSYIFLSIGIDNLDRHVAFAYDVADRKNVSFAKIREGGYIFDSIGDDWDIFRDGKQIY